MRYTPPTPSNQHIPFFLSSSYRKHDRGTSTLNPLPPLDNHPSSSDPATEPESATKPTLNTIKISDIMSTLA